jgi:hypothetical protein
MLMVVPIGGSGGGTKVGDPSFYFLLILFPSIIFATFIPDLGLIFLFYSGEVEIIYFTTPIKVVENYIEQSIAQRSENLRSERFRKTWFIRDGKNVGKGTIKAPSPSNPELRL